MSDPFVGEIRMFGGTYAPSGWLTCDGQLVPISDYQVLYTLVGTTYGGNGQTTFGIPDLRGRVPMGQGSGPGLTPRAIGQSFGTEQVSLTGAQTGHAHQLTALPVAGTQKTPAGALLAQIPSASGSLY
ncbi:MAG: phage tail protein, partial [bacterium]